MPVDAVGSAQSSQATAKTNLSQEDFIKLFLTELQFQDPMEPINNREFLAQMAQFANLEQARQSSESLSNLVESSSNLVFMSSTAQSVTMIGRTVTVVLESGPVTGVVKSVAFTQSGPLMSVSVDGGTSALIDVRLSQIQRVSN